MACCGGCDCWAGMFMAVGMYGCDAEEGLNAGAGAAATWPM